MSGRHRNPGLAKPARVAIVALVLVAGVGAYGAWRTLGQGGCRGQLQLTVAAAPEIAPALQRAADTWAQGVRGGGDECVTAQVVAAAPAEVALAVAQRDGVVLSGLTPVASPTPAPSGASPSTTSTVTATGSATATVTPTVRASTAPSAAPSAPDVWVPDSSTWLVRVRAASAGLVPAEARPVATSPVVLALPEPTARLLGWPERLPSWTDIVNLIMIGGTNLKLGIVEPNRDAVGLTSVMALGMVASTLPTNADEVTVAVMRALFFGRVRAESDLFARFPTADDPASLAAAVAAAPLSERALLSYNRTGPAVPLAALYVQPAPPALDYPYAIMPGISADRARLAEDLRATLTGATYLADLAEAGLRGPDGTAEFPAMVGAPAMIDTSQLDPNIVSRALAVWLTVIRPGRMLAVIDVSGSMAFQMPGAGGQSRWQVVTDAARQGLTLIDDTWSMGLWTFSTRINGSLDYLPILPIRSMTEQRPLLYNAVDTLQPIAGGGTGLYDTVLAAYQEVQRGWDPNSVNSVVIFTDGRNDDPNGISLPQLIAELQSLRDPRYPIMVIIIGFGTDVNQAELETIANATDGGAFIAREASEIADILVEAISLRPPAPAV